MFHFLRHFLEVRPVADIPIIPGNSIPALFDGKSSREIMARLIKCSNMDNFYVFNLCVASKIKCYFDQITCHTITCVIFVQPQPSCFTVGKSDR